MIGALVGTVFRARRNPLILMVGGVGYAVSVPGQLLQKTKPDDKLTLYTQTYAREDALALFGFASEEELELFELLQTVPGIGPRTALLVIDRGSAAIKHAVTSGDVDFFTTVPRLGRKNAQKIIIELKSKLGSLGELDLSDNVGETKEIIDALTDMGFKRKEIIEVVKKLNPEDTLAVKVKTALKMLGKS